MIATWGGQPVLTLAQRKPADPLRGLDRAIADLRGSLADSDRDYFDEVVARVRATGSAAEFAVVAYPPVNWATALKNAMASGWQNGDGWVMTALKAWTTRAWQAHARQWGANPLYDILAPMERRLVPHEAINQYVAKRIPPLKLDVELKRRELCRDIVADATRRGEGVRGVMEALERDGFGRSQWHRENIARTETATLYANGRHARMFSSSSVVGYRIKDIGDSRVCPICRAQNGRTYKRGDPGAVCEPFHYQCRCVSEAIFAWEAPDWSDPADLPASGQPLPGFGKFDFSQVRQADPRAFLRPLKDSDAPGVRAVIADLEKYLRRGRQ